MPFAFAQNSVNGTTTYILSGALNETANFPRFPDAMTKLDIDLESVQAMNSVGTRKWCDWIAEIELPEPARLLKCPAIMVKSFNSVVGAYTPALAVESFFVPYRAPSSGERHDILYVRGRDFNPGQTVPERFVENGNGERLEMDVSQDYFRFLVRGAE